MSIRLSDAVDEFLKSRAGNGFAANTIRNDRRTLLRFLTVVGNIYVKNITQRHIDEVMADAGTTQADASLNLTQTSLSAFFAWCRVRGHMRKDHDPLAGRRLRRVPKPDRRRVPVGQFPALLEAAEHPRDRMVVALGLFLFLRQSEIATLKIQDVSLANGEVRVVVHKTKGLDYMPISSELDRELRRWLTIYTEATSTAYLTPAKHIKQLIRNPNGTFLRSVASDTLRPMRKISRVEEVAQRALNGIGFPTRGDDGQSLREGIHTLRRSGARALFDELQGRGYDGALRQVSAMLHHSSVTTTEHYLGLDLDRKQRDEAIKGHALFPSLAAGRVIPYPSDRGRGEDLAVRQVRADGA